MIKSNNDLKSQVDHLEKQLLEVNSNLESYGRQSINDQIRLEELNNDILEKKQRGQDDRIKELERKNSSLLNALTTCQGEMNKTKSIITTLVSKVKTYQKGEHEFTPKVTTDTSTQAMVVDPPRPARTVIEKKVGVTYWDQAVFFSLLFFLLTAISY